MADIERTIDGIVPQLFSEVANDLGMPASANMAASNQCHVLSKGLWLALRQRGIEARREFHMAQNGDWHYLIAHTPQDAEASAHDIITDLNPWQFESRHSGTYLHGSRAEVMSAMEQGGASMHVRSLRDLSTIALTHTVDIVPPHLQTQRPQLRN